jgi:short-subunit dehydrogenase
MEPAHGDQAVITGASAGIGAALARALASAGYDLVLVARRGDRLEALAEELRAGTGREVAVEAMDVTAPDALERLLEAAPRPAVLVNNAGAGKFGRVTEQSPDEAGFLVRLNCEALTRLTVGFVPAMRARGKGVIVNIASIAGFQPVPYFAVYAATKAYVLSLSEALDVELAASGVRVVAVCPGPVPTEFQAQAGSPDAREDRHHVTPEAIAEATLAAIRSPRRVVTPVASHRWMHFAQRIAPRGLVLRLAAKKMRARGV